MMKQTVLLALLLISSFAFAQKPDTVTVNLAPSSKMVLTIGDRNDLEQLKRYDFAALFADILQTLETADSTQVPEPSAEPSPEPETAPSPEPVPNVRVTSESNSPHSDWDFHCNRNHRGVYHTFNFEFGINNWLENGSFPDYNNAQYTVRPWGSWYVGLNSILHTDVSKSMFIEWGFGISWYNFKFQDDATLITKTDTGTEFTSDTRPLDFTKSKLTASYLNVSIVPMFAFGHARHHIGWDDHGHDAFRIGIGPYAGYRLGSHSKLVHKDSGDKVKEKDHDNFYLNNFRYGVKLQFGTRGVEFFCAYDLNSMFAKDRGPDLNALTFGLVF